MQKYIKTLNADKIIRLGSLASGVLIGANIIVVLLSFGHLPPYIPLFNQMPWGEARLGIKTQMFIPGIIATISFFLNLFFSGILYEKIPLVSRILCITSLLVCFLTFLLVVETVQIIL